MSIRSRLLLDNFTLALIATVVAASFLPSSPMTIHAVDQVAMLGVSVLFFLYGARLSRQAIVAGLGHWRLHVMVAASTFVMFPLLGLGLQPLLEPLVTPELYLGILFVCVLPSTVQSSIAFTAIARGNLPAAICSASLSNLAGVFLTPMLVSALIVAQQEAGAASASDAVLRIMAQLFLPFVAGQMARRWIGNWMDRYKSLLAPIDQGVILLVVFAAFSEAVAEGMFGQLPLQAMLALLVACVLLLALAMILTTYASRRLGFSREDEIAIVFCGSKKSMASGIPMAKVLFASSSVGLIVLPLILFHQIQLMVCAVLAQRYAQRAAAPIEALAEGS